MENVTVLHITAGHGWNPAKMIQTDKGCAICGESPAYMDVFCNHPICSNHRMYSHIVNPEIIQLREMRIDRLPERFNECEVCGNELTEAERFNIDLMESTITCKDHREVRMWLLKGRAKEWVQYKTDVNPEAKLRFETSDREQKYGVPPQEFTDWLMSRGTN